MFHDEKIDYTAYLRDNPQEMDPLKISAMDTVLRGALRQQGVYWPVTAMYFANGCVMVCVNGEIRMFNTNTGKFFAECAGDQAGK